MVSRSFRANCIIRVILLSTTIFLFFFMLSQTPEICAILGFLIVLEVFGLIRFVDRTNKELARFFESVRYGDFSQTFRSKRLGGSFRPLLDAMADVNEAFRKTRAEKEEQTHFLETVVQHVGVGLLAFQPDGTVELINNAAKRLLKVTGIKNISSLESVSPALVMTLQNLRPPQKSLVKIELADEPLQLVLHSTELRLRGRAVTLVSLQNIRSEIENTEIEAWQKLIRVLTHEIMNSITPIASMASTIKGLIRRMPKRGKTPEISDIGQAVTTIQKRSEGLLRFVDAYRNLAALPKANLQILLVRELFDRFGRLLEADFRSQGITFETSSDPENLEMLADPELIEQVLINLGLNALQAVQGMKNARIRFEARLDSRGKVLIDVADNGSGIPQENLEKIFIPFYSTKKGGSGIGLSLSRQIMRLHNGTLTVRSKPGEETVFTMRF